MSQCGEAFAPQEIDRAKVFEGVLQMARQYTTVFEAQERTLQDQVDYVSMSRLPLTQKYARELSGYCDAMEAALKRFDASDDASCLLEALTSSCPWQHANNAARSPTVFAQVASPKKAEAVEAQKPSEVTPTVCEPCATPQRPHGCYRCVQYDSNGQLCRH